MARSSKKGPFIDQKLLKKVLRQKNGTNNTPIKTWARDSVVSPDFVGSKLAIHNGKNFVEILVSESMVGHHLGEFAPTRIFRGHGQVTKRVLEKT